MRMMPAEICATATLLKMVHDRLFSLFEFQPVWTPAPKAISEPSASVRKVPPKYSVINA